MSGLSAYDLGDELRAKRHLTQGKERSRPGDARSLSPKITDAMNAAHADLGD